MEGAASEDGRTPSIWDTYAHDGTRSIFFFRKKTEKKNLHVFAIRLIFGGFNFNLFLPRRIFFIEIFNRPDTDK